MCTFCENIGHNSKFVTERNTHRNMQREAAGDRPCYATGKMRRLGVKLRVAGMLWPGLGASSAGPSGDVSGVEWHYNDFRQRAITLSVFLH